MAADMFEGKLPKAQKAQDSAVQTRCADSLRAMTWSDLRARLDAARDLRSAIVDSDHEAPASFDVHSARRIAALANGKEAVNLDDLGIGKGTGCKKATSFDDGTRSDRGNT